MAGECVGVNSQIDINPSIAEPSWMGISYSIDGNFARRIAKRIIQDGAVVIPETITIERMGIMVEELIGEDGEKPVGLHVADVSIYSPLFFINVFSEKKGAGSAGINSDDTILECNGAFMETPADLQEAVDRIPPGGRILLRVEGIDGEQRFVTDILP